MIKSKEDYLYYLEMDKQALGRKGRRPGFLRDEIWRFQRLLRKIEYLDNCCKSIQSKLYGSYLKLKFKKLSTMLGFTIPLNTFGPGLSIAHRGTIVVNSMAKIGSNCRIHVCVNIGAYGGPEKAPQIGDNVYIGPGAKIFGDIRVADGIKIGANAVVNKSFLEPNITIVGVPAEKIVKKKVANSDETVLVNHM